MIKSKWDLDEAEGMLWIGVEAGKAFMGGMNKFYGFSLTRNVCYFDHENHFNWYTLTSELIEIGNKCLESFKNANFRDKIKHDMEKIRYEINRTIMEYQSKDKTQINVNELFDFLRIFTVLYTENISAGLFAEPFDFIFPEKFKNAFEKYKLSQSEFLDIVALPDTSFMNLHNQDLIKLAIEKKKGIDIKQSLKEHLLKYEWIATGHSGKKQLDINYFIEKINHILDDNKDLEEEFKHLKEFKKNANSKINQLIKKYDFDEEALTMLHIQAEIGPLHDIRKEGFVKTIYYGDDIREELGRRFGYTMKELQVVTYDELLVLKKEQKLDKNMINERLKKVLVNVDGKKGIFEILTGKDAQVIIDKEFNQKYDDVDELKGMCASVGKAKGLVKIIYGPKDFHKMNKGDILVTGMTRPEMLPAMKIAAAFVTDEGGIASHAAIISREMKIPCVIATQIATKILKDGDLVEVDADKGIIKKIK